MELAGDGAEMMDFTRTVLGVDAAWTEREPSGVALVGERGGRWRLIHAAPSYGHFFARANGLDVNEPPHGAAPNADQLIAAATKLAGTPPDLVAIDMPLATVPIVARREADNAVSRTYGGRKCGTHTPSALRPGPISDRLRAGFDAIGYPLLTTEITPPGLIEVYPHPALVELTGAEERLPYKASKVRTYWRTSSTCERQARLLEVWGAISSSLELVVTGSGDAVAAQPVGTGKERKGREDMIDAIVCCVVGIEALLGRARPFGDRTAAIWIPTSRW